VLSFSLAGDGEINLSLVAKKPGPALHLGVARASIPLARPARSRPAAAYVRLIHDALLGDRSLFTRPDGLAAVWDMAEPLLSRPPRVNPYPARIVGTRSGAGARPAGTLAPRPVTPGPVALPCSYDC
jgi:glucose-6-phosphate 1-dehydrogenase